MSPVYLRAPAYSHGELRPIAEIAELRADPDLLATLHAVGLETYARHDGAVEELAAAVLGDTLRAAGLQGGDIDAFVYASSLYSRGQVHDTMEPSRLMGRIAQEAGLTRAVPHGVSFTQCVNTVSAFELARGLVLAGARHVLVLAADKIEGQSRMVEPGISVISDTAGCVLVSGERGNGAAGTALRIDNVAHFVDWSLQDVKTEDDFGEYVKRTVGGMSAAIGALQRADGLPAASYAQLLTNTINHSVVRIFSRASGLPTDRVYRGNVNRLAHCDAADVIVNLRDWLDLRRAAAGERVILAANGPFAWGAVSATLC
ncbi:hypothetical protein [Ramlibacter sp.]|uniref:hypothetical protein n=1 Tax=Ramlibacter sp. TaxID=1917967 RepID=UPI0017F8DF0F|nr:hypothetical protein [Ramlibacter sp.]MBA2676728.1 hypothetical protein [Ramlibacter sp.]